MALRSSAIISLSTNYYLRNFYSSNRDASKAAKRKAQNTSALSKADSEALRRGAKKLRNFDYSSGSLDTDNIYSSVAAYVETYNNALSSSGSSSDASLARYSKYLKNLSKEYTNELKDIGITVENDGSLSLNENLLKSADISDVEKLFADDAEFASKASRHARRMKEKAENLIYTSLTKSGANVNIVL